MIVNFSDDECIIILASGVELRICEDEAKDLADQIHNYYMDETDEIDD